MVTYELRSRSGNPLIAFDSLTRAKEYQADANRRHGTRLTLYEVKRVERMMDQ